MMSDGEETFYVSMKVNDMPINPIPSVKLMCSGGCGDEVWVDKRLERLWSKFPVLCLECGLKSMEYARAIKEKISFQVAPESIESLMNFFMERDEEHKS